MRRRRASDLRSLLLRGHGAVVDEADEFGEVDEERARVNAGSGSHNLDAPLPGAPKMSGKLIHEHLWGPADRAPFGSAGAEIARRADRGEAHEQFTQVQAARMRKTLLLLYGLY